MFNVGVLVVSLWLLMAILALCRRRLPIRMPRGGERTARAGGLRPCFTLIELLVVIAIIGVMVGLLMAALHKVRSAALASRLAKEHAGTAAPEIPGAPDKLASTAKPVVQRLRARVKSFVADVALTPRLSVGTAEPESIYEARFTGKVEAVQPGDAAGDCEIELPLPPSIISLADLSVTAGGMPSERVSLREGRLVWQGPLGVQPTAIDVTYTAVGKGLYELSVPPAGILDQFKITLAAHGSDVRMLELSLQPTGLDRSAGTTTYTWNYKSLLFGQPIRLDVLGIAPIDRLGELTWLGPLSVVVFGLIVGLAVHAAGAVRFDRWMLLLTVGTFAGSYPLMYFAQEFISLSGAVALSAGMMLFIIGIRSFTILGFRLAMGAVIIPAGAVLALTLVVAIWPRLQGILLTAEALAFFVTAMTLIPKLRLASAEPSGQGPVSLAPTGDA